LSVVRIGINRTLAAGIVAVLSAGAMLVPLEASARAGGFAAGHAIFNHGEFRRFGGPLFIWSGPLPPAAVSGGPVAHVRASRLEPARHHRRVFGVGLPLSGIGGFYGPLGDPIANVGAIDRPAGARAADDTSPVPEGVDRIGVNRDGCRSQTRIVPSEAGGERPIRITWCRGG
jgi:hypothetical protein